MKFCQTCGSEIINKGKNAKYCSPSCSSSASSSSYYERNKDVLKRKRKEKYKENPLKYMLTGARYRANKADIDFSIGEGDLVIPEICPLLEIPIYIGEDKLSKNSPTIDRIDSSKGYVKGNVWIISHRANMIKNNSEIHELEKLLANLKNRLDKS